MSDVIPDEDVAVSIGADHLRHLERVAEAASDLKRASHDAEFAAMFGGMDRLQADLFMHTASWEAFASANLSEERT